MDMQVLKEIFDKIAAGAASALNDFMARPDDLAMIRDLLNCDANGAADELERLGCELRRFKRGEVPSPMLTEWHSSCMRLIDALIERHPEVPALNKTRSAQCGLYRLLDHGYAKCEDDESYWAEIEKKIVILKKFYRSNSDGFNELLVEERRAKRPGVAGKAEGSSRKRRPRRVSEEIAAQWRERDEILAKINEIYLEHKAKRPRYSRTLAIRVIKNSGGWMAQRLRTNTDRYWEQEACRLARTSKRK